MRPLNFVVNIALFCSESSNTPVHLQHIAWSVFLACCIISLFDHLNICKPLCRYFAKTTHRKTTVGQIYLSQDYSLQIYFTRRSKNLMEHYGTPEILGYNGMRMWGVGIKTWRDSPVFFNCRLFLKYVRRAKNTSVRPRHKKNSSLHYKYNGRRDSENSANYFILILREERYSRDRSEPWKAKEKYCQRGVFGMPVF